MISEHSQNVARRAKAIYTGKLQAQLESDHPNQFVAKTKARRALTFTEWFVALSHHLRRFFELRWKQAQIFTNFELHSVDFREKSR